MPVMRGHGKGESPSVLRKALTELHGRLKERAQKGIRRINLDNSEQLDYLEDSELLEEFKGALRLWLEFKECRGLAGDSDKAFMLTKKLGHLKGFALLYVDTAMLQFYIDMKGRQ